MVASPCTGVCRMERALCVGCGRTIDEIMGWGTASEADRRAVIARIAARGGRPRG